MVYHDSQIALGTNCTISIYTDSQKKSVEKLFQILWLKIFEFEKSFSRFIPGSELTIFNSKAGTEQKISKTFKDILLQSLSYYRATNGMFNPFILPALEKAGYDHSLLKGFENDLYVKHENAEIVDFDQLKIFEDSAYIPKNSAIDLGGIGKGYLLDLLAGFLMDYKDEFRGFWISLGGDVVTYGYQSTKSPIKTFIEKDSDSVQENIGFVLSSRNEKKAVATSGVNYRKGLKDNKAWHHIIDPVSGQPAKTDITMATVFGDSAAYCDVMASCLIIAGKNRFLDTCQEFRLEDALIQGYIGMRNSDDYYIESVGQNIKIKRERNG